MAWLEIPSVLLGLGLGLGGSLLGSRLLVGRSSQSVSGTDLNGTDLNLTDQLAQPEAPQPSFSEQDLQERLIQMQAAYQMAIQMGQFKAGFLARVSHELRSPLNSMIGTQQLILSDLCDDPAEEREFIAQSYESALKMMRLIDRILDVSKTEAGTDALELQSVSLEKVLQEVYSLTELQAQNRNLKLSINPPAEEIVVFSDQRRLTQVLLLLVETPLVLMPEGKVTVSVQLAPEKRVAQIVIEDERPAKSWEEPASLLQDNPLPDPIATAHPSIPDLSPGMKLLMAQQLLELMQGQLEILATPIQSDAADPEPGLTRIQCSVPLA